MWSRPEANQIRFVRENLAIGAANAHFPLCNYLTPCSMARSTCLIIGGEDHARFRPN
jgi:hypothetical protein